MQRQQKFDQDPPAPAGKAASIIALVCPPRVFAKTPHCCCPPLWYTYPSVVKRKTHLPMKNSSQPQPIKPMDKNEETKRALKVSSRSWPGRLATEAVEGAALPLEGVDNVERGDGLALGVLGVGDGVTDDTLEEGLENTAGLLVDHWRRVRDVS